MKTRLKQIEEIILHVISKPELGQVDMETKFREFIGEGESKLNEYLRTQDIWKQMLENDA